MRRQLETLLSCAALVSAWPAYAQEWREVKNDKLLLVFDVPGEANISEDEDGDVAILRYQAPGSDKSKFFLEARSAPSSSDMMNPIVRFKELQEEKANRSKSIDALGLTKFLGYNSIVYTRVISGQHWIGLERNLIVFRGSRSFHFQADREDVWKRMIESIKFMSPQQRR